MNNPWKSLKGKVSRLRLQCHEKWLDLTHWFDGLTGNERLFIFVMTWIIVIMLFGRLELARTITYAGIYAEIWNFRTTYFGHKPDRLAGLR